jgi:aldehyde:ferredoxin oxidoreductase
MGYTELKVLIIMAEDKNKHYPYRERSILVIDLTNDEYSVVPLKEKFCRKYIGGKALAFQMWDKYAEYEKLSSEDFYSGNPIVFALGSAADLSYDYCASSTIVSLSYETGTLVSYNFTSKYFVNSMASLGYSALIIKGRARRLTAVEISKEKILIEINESYHLLSTTEVEEKLQGNSVISIGPVGELLLDYASVVIDSKSVGRGGIGAMFGLKNLKVLSFNTENSFRKAYFPEKAEDISSYFLSQKLGNTNLLNESNKYGWAAIDGFKTRFDPRLWGLGGTEITPLAEMDWLTSLALGANLGFFNYDKVEILSQCCLELGFDPYSVGPLFIWMENAIKDKVVLYNMDKNNSRLENYLLFLEAVAKGKSHVTSFSKGVDKLSKYYGAKEDYNFTSHGKELLPLDLRALPSFALAVALDDDTFVPWEMVGNKKKGKEAEALFTAQIYREMLEDLGFNYKSTLKMLAKEGGITEKKNRKLYKKLADFLSISEGYIVDSDDLLKIAKEAFFENKRILEKVNKPKSSISEIPIHFVNDMSSNFDKDEVVVIGRSLDSYHSLIEIEMDKLNALNTQESK